MARPAACMGRVTMSLGTHYADGVVGWADAFVDPGRMEEIGASPGDVLELVGNGRTLARCRPAYPGLGGAHRRHSGEVSISGGKVLDLGAGHWGAVEVGRADAAPARAVTLAPNGPVPEADPRYLADRLDGVPLAAGDTVRVQYLPRHKVRFQVTRVEPAGVAAVATAETAFRVAASGEGSRAVPRVIRGGAGILEADVERLRRMIGARLAGRGAAGPGAPCGAVVHGDTLSETSLLVRTAAAACGAHLAVVDVDCMMNSIYARQLREGPCEEGSGAAALRDWVAAAAATAGAGERMLGFYEEEPWRIVEAARRRAPSVVLFDLNGHALGPLSKRDADMINRYRLRGGGRRGPEARPGQVSEISRGIASLVPRLSGSIGRADRVAVVTCTFGLDSLPPPLAATGFAGEIGVSRGRYGIGDFPTAAGP